MNGTASEGGRAIQRHEAGVSVEALAAAWARRDNIASGSVVVVEAEIAARYRLGEPWVVPSDDSLAMAMVLRPTIALDSQGLLWLVGALAAVRAGSTNSDFELTIGWPDSLTTPGADLAVGQVNIVTQLGPGRLEHAIVSVRFSLVGLGISAEHKPLLLESLIAELDLAAALLIDDPHSLIDAAVASIPIVGERVKALLFPKGEARGTVTAIDPQGRLVLRTPTGMLEYLDIEKLRSIEPA